jgi:tight adherence protein C
MEPLLLLSLGVAAIFGALVLVFVGLGVGSTERQAVSRSLAAIDAMSTASPDLRSRELERPFGERVLQPATQRLSDLGRRFTPADQAERLQRRLDLAGNPEGWDVDRVLAFKVLATAAGAFLGFVLPVLSGSSVGVVLLAGAAGTVLGYFLPAIALYQLSATRSERIQKELPDALDLMTISVEAGLAFDAAVAQVARNTDGPLADEFFRVLSEMQIGRGRIEALRALGERTDVDDLKTFVTAMVQADSFGIPIADVLRTQAHEMRVRRRQRAEELAQQVPVKIIFPLLLCIMPALFVVVIGPAAISVVRELLPAL